MILHAILVVAAHLFGRTASSSLSDDQLQFDNLLKNGQALVELQNEAEFVVLVGMAGTGKSTLSKFVTNDAGLVVVRGQGGKCIFKDDVGAVGTQSQTSRTTVPNAVRDAVSQQLLIDCPGFADTRKNPANDIAAALFVKMVLGTAKRIKVIVVENHSSLEFNDSRDDWLTTLAHLAKLIPRIERLVGGLGLVITKVDSNDSDEDVIQYARDYIEDTLQNHLLVEHRKIANDINLEEQRLQTEREIAVARALLEGRHNVAVFRTPCRKRSGTTITCSDCHGSNDLRDLVFKQLVFQESQPSFFAISVSDASKLFIEKKLLRSTENTVTNQIDAIISEKLQAVKRNINMPGLALRERFSILSMARTDFEFFLESTMERSGLLDFLEEHIDWKVLFYDRALELSFELHKLGFFQECLEGSKMHLLTKIQEDSLVIIDQYAKSTIEELSTINQIHNFLEKVSSYMEYKAMRHFAARVTHAEILDEFFNEARSIGMKEPFTISEPSKQFLKQVNETSATGGLSVAPRVWQNESETIINGHFVILSEVIGKIPNKSHAVFLLASRKIYVDADWKLENTHLTIISPSLEIVGSRTFHLSGSDASSHQRDASSSFLPDTPGMDGAAGNFGFSSGTLKIFTNNTVNGQNLSIHLSGGAGGNGQRGGNGFPGLNATMKFSSFQDIANCISDRSPPKPGVDCDHIPVIKISEMNDAGQCKVEVTLENGLAPTDGGKGGDGGPGGVTGRFVTNRGENDFQHSKTNGLNGHAADGGIAGSVRCTQLRTLFDIECVVLYSSFYASTLPQGWDAKTHCVEHFNAFDGTQGQNRTTEHLNYMFAEPSISRLNSIGLIMLGNILETMQNSSSLLMNVKLFLDVHLRTNEHQITTMIDQFVCVFKMLPNYDMPLDIRSKLNYFLYELFLSRKEDLKKIGGGDVSALEVLILSHLDLVEAMKSKIAFSSVKSQLKFLKTEGEDLETNWVDLYKKSVYNGIDVAFEINIIKADIKRLVSQLQQVREDLGNKFERIYTGQPVDDLSGKRYSVQQIFWERLLLDVLQQSAGVWHVFMATVGRHSTVETEYTTGWNHVENRNIVLAEVEKPSVKLELENAKNAAARTDFLLSVANDVQQADRSIGGALTEATRGWLKATLEMVPLNLNKLSKVFEVCRTELEFFENLEDAEGVLQTLEVLRLVPYVDLASADVIADIPKIQHAADLMHELLEAIATNKLALLRLRSHVHSFEASFSPLLAITATHPETLDLRSAMRRFGATIRRFTEAFLMGRPALVGVANDLEALAAALATIHAHSLQLRPKLALAELLQEGEEMREDVASMVGRNALLSRLARLEHSFHHAIFPHPSFLGHLRPEADHGELLERVDTMLSKLSEHHLEPVAETVLFSWRPDHHAEQIRRFLRGEKVSLVASSSNRSIVWVTSVGLQVAGIDLRPLQLQLVHRGDGHFRCGARLAIAASEPLTLHLAPTQTVVLDTPLALHATWTVQLVPGADIDASARLAELAMHAPDTSLELYGNAIVTREDCEDNSLDKFDLLLL